MTFSHFSKNDAVLSLDQAVIPLNSIEYAYGFGVYETIRVVRGVPQFLPDHVQRLLASATYIDLEHSFTDVAIMQTIRNLIEALGSSTPYNLKALLIGAGRKYDAQLFILPLAPLFPDKKLYRHGVKTLSVQYERFRPQAKTLNMLPTYIHYRTAKKAGCYDALFINRAGRITEGSRTNFFAISGRKIITAPDEEVLGGVTRKYILQTAQKNGFKVEKQSLTFEEITQCDGAFLSGTSIDIVPIKTIDQFTFGEIPRELRDLMELYDHFKNEFNEASMDS